MAGRHSEDIKIMLFEEGVGVGDSRGLDSSVWADIGKDTK